MTTTMTIPMTGARAPADFKHQARRLRQALGEEGFHISHGKALDLVARQSGSRDWNTLAANGTAAETQATDERGAPYRVGQRIAGRIHATPFEARIIAVEETIKRDLWRITLQFELAVDVVTSPHFSMLRRRLTIVVGADGKSRRLTGSETGGVALDV